MPSITTASFRLARSTVPRLLRRHSLHFEAYPDPRRAKNSSVARIHSAHCVHVFFQTPAANFVSDRLFTRSSGLTRRQILQYARSPSFRERLRLKKSSVAGFDSPHLAQRFRRSIGGSDIA